MTEYIKEITVIMLVTMGMTPAGMLKCLLGIMLCICG